MIIILLWCTCKLINFGDTLLWKSFRALDENFQVKICEYFKANRKENWSNRIKKITHFVLG